MEKVLEEKKRFQVGIKENEMRWNRCRDEEKETVAMRWNREAQLKQVNLWLGFEQRDEVEAR